MEKFTVSTEASNVENLSKWREAKEVAVDRLVEELGFALDSEPTPEKVTEMKEKRDALFAMMQGNETPGAFRVEHYMLREVGRQIVEDEELLAEDQAGERLERMKMPVEPPQEFADNVVVVDFQNKQYRAPADKRQTSVADVARKAG